MATKKVTGKTIKQSVSFKALPSQVYNALIDSKLHAKFSKAKAKISKKIGGKFTAYDGYLTGKNLILVPGKKIVQSWHSSEWAKGHMSKVTFIFKKIKTGTKLMFTHNNVPLNDVKDVTEGWKKFYWQPMKKMLEKK